MNAGRAAVLLVLLAGAAGGCVTAPDEAAVESADGRVRVVSRDPGFARPDLSGLAHRAQGEYARLRAHFGTDVGPVTVVVSDRRIAVHRPPATVHIPSRTLRQGSSITAHEITHLLTQGWASRVLKEGLAVYAQDRFGARRGWPNYRRSIHGAARRWVTRTDSPVRAPDEAEAALASAKLDDIETRQAAYSVAGSWVTWLIEEKFAGDIAGFMDRLYRSGDYRGATGTALPVLLRQWYRFLQASP